MIRPHLVARAIGHEPGFRWRSHEITRIEGLSDAVFAFAVTLLVVSLEVPKTFTELMGMMRGFLGFAVCFAILIQVWYEQYRFFRRYGLQDTPTLLLNAALLFVVLFYVYPLKFLFTMLVNEVLGLRPGAESPIEAHQIPTLMTIYGLGFLAVFAIFMALHVHARRLAEQLELTVLEVHDTSSSIQGALVNMGIATVSIALANSGSPRAGALSGFVYFALGPLAAIHGSWRGKTRRKLQAAAP